MTLLSCDWGTTNVRLRRVDVDTGRVLAETSAAEGVKAVYARWRSGGGDRLVHYVEALRPMLDAVGDAESDRALVVSGMASSTIGLAELPYAEVPFRLDGSDFVYRIVKHGGVEMPILLLSGVRTADDVMRGEETELIGLARSMETSGRWLVILPGTHSKHVSVEAGAVTGFQTFMTGELFEVLTSGSILRESVQAAPFDADAFEHGVLSSRERPLSSALFTVRTNVLLDRMSAMENYWVLSGLLVGAELASIALEDERGLVLCGTFRSALMYRAALDVLGLDGATVTVDESAAERAAVDGHLVAFKKLMADT